MSKKNRIRIYIDADLVVGNVVECDEKQSHYLINVMRLKQGDEVFVFNGRDGEFCSQVKTIQKKKCELLVVSRFCEYRKSPDIWLLFAPLKKNNMDFVVEKATELGVQKIIPIISEYTSNLHPNVERMKTQVIEACEQCRRQDVPVVENCIDLKKLLSNWDKNRKLIYLDETLQSEVAKVQMERCLEPVAILVGPEGGFSEKELENLRKLDYTYGVSLGNRILRAETAAIAALSCWQALAGDWQ